jgi:hypothetical protein
VPAVSSYLFYGEVAVVYLLVLTYATLVISYLNLKEALPLNLLALGTVLFTYFNRSFLLDHAPLDFLLRVGGFAVLVALGLVFYIFRKKLLKIVD